MPNRHRKSVEPVDSKLCFKNGEGLKYSYGRETFFHTEKKFKLPARIKGRGRQFCAVFFFDFCPLGGAVGRAVYV